MIIGITGGVGSGKSTVLRMLKDKFGAAIYMADEYGHMAYMPQYSTFKEIIEMFGSSILDGYGEIDREKVAQLVYQDEHKLKTLNKIIHPFVWDHIEADIKKNKENNLHIIESAILIEAGYESMCDKVWGVFAPQSTRIQRLIDDRGYSTEKAISIMKRQMTEWDLKSRVDAEITNDGNLDKLQHQLEKLLGIKSKI